MKLFNNASIASCLFYRTSKYDERYDIEFSSAAKTVVESGAIIGECNRKNRSAKRTCVGFDVLLFHSVGVLVLKDSIRELKCYK